MKKILLLLVLALFGSIEGNSFPSLSKKCKKSDENFNKCLTETANTVWPDLVKSNDSWATIYLEPIDADIIQLAQFKFNDGQISGLEDAHFTDIKVNFKKQIFYIIFTVPRMNLDGILDIKGNILGLDLKDISPMNSTFLGGIYNFRFKYDLEETDGEQYAQVKNEELLYNIDGLTINLKSADRTKGARANKLFNDNWKILNIAGNQVASKVFAKGFASLVQRFFKEVPFNSLFE